MNYLMCEAEKCECHATYFDSDLLEFRCETHRTLSTESDLFAFHGVPSYAERFIHKGGETDEHPLSCKCEFCLIATWRSDDKAREEF